MDTLVQMGVSRLISCLFQRICGRIIMSGDCSYRSLLLLDWRPGHCNGWALRNQEWVENTLSIQVQPSSLAFRKLRDNEGVFKKLLLRCSLKKSRCL